MENRIRQVHPGISDADISNLTGLFQGIPEDKYHRQGGASNSRLGHILRSPAHALEQVLNKGGVVTPAKRTGRIVHSAVLEGDSFEAIHKLIPDDFDKRTAARREQFAEWEEEYGEGRVIKEKEAVQAKRIRDVVWEHRDAGAIMKSPTLVTEVSAFWSIEARVSAGASTQVRCKARLDGVDEEEGRLPDLKTCDDARPWSFSKSVHTYGYYRQQAFYSEVARFFGLELPDRPIIAVEKTPPYGVRVYRLDDMAFQWGKDELRELLTIWCRCTVEDKWPCYDEGVEEIGLPDYAYAGAERFG